MRATYALSLNHAVDEGTGEGSDELLSGGMGVGLAVGSAVLLVGLGSLGWRVRECFSRRMTESTS